MEKEFIKERSNKHKVEIVITTITIVTFLFAVFFIISTLIKEGIIKSDFFHAFKSIFEEDIKQMTPIGLFYMSLFGNLLFVPLPIELPFFLGIQNGNPPWISLMLVMAGLIPAYAFDYFVGTKFSKIIFTFISTKKIYKSKRWVNKYGGYAILFFNLTPLPSNELTFALGIAKYNITRLFVLTILGSLTKFLLIMAFAWIT